MVKLKGILSKLRKGLQFIRSRRKRDVGKTTRAAPRSRAAPTSRTTRTTKAPANIRTTTTTRKVPTTRAPAARKYRAKHGKITKLKDILSKKELQFIMFGGKGGVGKTTCAAAAGIYMAKHGKKTLVFSANPAHALSDSFNQKIGENITPINDVKNLYALEIDAGKVKKELDNEYEKDYAQIFKELDESGMNLPFERKIMKDFINFPPPGLDELMALRKLEEFIEKADYDIIIVDMAASGHALRLLQLPDIIIGWLELALKMYEDYAAVMRLERTRKKTEEIINSIKKLRSSFVNPKKTEFITVMFPESMVIYETEDLLKGVSDCDVSANNIIVNYITKALPLGCKYCAARKQQQQKHIKEINKKFSKYNITEVPMFLQEVRGIEALKDFSKALFEGYKPKYPAKIEKVRIIDIKKMPILDIKKDLQFIILGGKGGRGKTTSAASIGIHMAKHGKKTLVFSTDPAPSLSDSFNQKIGENIMPIKGVENLWAVEMNAKKLFEEFRKQYKEDILDIIEKSTYVKREDLTKFFEFSIPGIDEVMAIRKIINIMKQEKYDLIILDTAPTGHTLRFLELPDLMLIWVGFLTELREKTQYIMQTFYAKRLKKKPDSFLRMMKRDTKEIKSILSDAERTEFIPVTILEDIPIAETGRFIKTLTSYGIPTKHIILNKIIMAVKCHYCSAKAKSQQEHIKSVFDKFKDFKIIGMPFFSYEIHGLDNLTKFSETLFEKK